MNETINICVCLPSRYDTRTPKQREASLASFHALDPRIRFRYVEYHDNPESRTLRIQPNYEDARDRAEPPSPELRAALADTHIILTVDLPFDMHRLAPELRWVQSVGAGIGQLQTCGLGKLDALLTSGAGITADAIAEFVLGRILGHWKRFSFYADMQREKRWVPATGRKLAGSTLGIVGLGAIGRAVAWRARAWGVRVLATRRTARPDDTDPTVDDLYPANQMQRMLAEADAVVLCAAESPGTYRLFDAEAFAAMREGSFFCNVSRGSLVDEDALREALEREHLAGAAIDVTDTEPLPPDSPLWTTPNLAISPHSAASMDGFFEAAWELFYDNMKRYLAGEPLINRRDNSNGG